MTTTRSIAVSALLISILSVTLLGCTPQEQADAQVFLQQTLSNLVQNRALTEQFVRDVKTNVDPSNPGYLETMQSYQEARETYNRYLDEAESGDKVPHTRQLRGRTAVDVQNRTADFIADATAVLKPGLNTRKIPFQRAVIVPDNLAASIRKLPKHARERLIDDLDPQVRWRSWSEF